MNKDEKVTQLMTEKNQTTFTMYKFKNDWYTDIELDKIPNSAFPEKYIEEKDAEWKHLEKFNFKFYYADNKYYTYLFTILTNKGNIYRKYSVKFIKIKLTDNFYAPKEETTQTEELIQVELCS